MRLVAMISAALLAASTACADDVATPGTDFTLSGTVVDVRTGVAPEDVPDIDEDTDVDPRPGAQGATEIEPGALVVEAEEELEGCAPAADGYTVFYRAETAFDPVDTTEADDFPVQLEDRQVDIRGRFFSDEVQDEAACVLVAQTVTVNPPDDVEETDGGFSPGPQPNEVDATPGAAPSP